MRNEFSIEELVTDLRPVRCRSPWRDAALLVSVAVVELAVYHLLGFKRPDFAQAMYGASLSWKLGSLLLIALTAVATALRSLAPERSPRIGLRGVAAAVVLALLAGAALGGLPSSLADAARRLNWRDGLACVKDMVLLSIPPAVAFALPARRGAPTDIGGTALAAGLWAAGWGAFVFAFACPSDDPFYIAVWFAVGCGFTALVARLVIARLARW